ncbi:MAG TPA: hypothetical protein VIA62_27110 [Thermoanaerobaculia bacterium]|nr:hypothetical protein [Thermoanaerobaculia bacterium]
MNVNAAVLLTVFLPLLAAVPGGKWALPLLAPLTLYFPFRERVRERDYFGAWTLSLAWAFLLSLGVILLVFWLPDAARTGILHGEDYRRQMFGWVATGEAPENDWRQFLPQHLLHLAIFLVLTWTTAGYLGLALGAGLVAYMSYFVGSYAMASGHPFLGALAAWVPWSVLRVCAFVLLGSVFSRPLLVRRVWPFEREEYRLMGLAFSGIVADLLIKAAFAPGYGIFLRRMAASLLTR